MSSLSPKVDLVFRKFFGSEENKDILLDFLNSILQEKIEDIEITNPYDLTKYKVTRASIIQIKAKDNEGSLYNIELQLGSDKFYDRRALFYWSRLYSDQLNESEIYSNLKKTIGIHILDFNKLPGLDYHNEYKLTNVLTNEQLNDDFELHFIELKKFNKDLEPVSSSLERWITFFNKSLQYNQNNIPDQLAVDNTIAKAITKLEVMGLSDDERDLYEEQLKDNRDYANQLYNLHYDIVTNLFKEGQTIEFIAKITGLSRGEIQSIKDL